MFQLLGSNSCDIFSPELLPRLSKNPLGGMDMQVDKETQKREWVKPSFERQDLKDALTGLSNANPADGTSGYS
jgi:hypothetical protein